MSEDISPRADRDVPAIDGYPADYTVDEAYAEHIADYARGRVAITITTQGEVFR